MNWEAAGAIGEIVGAAAVVMTLLYLAVQTRKNSQALDATTTREFGFHLSEWARESARDPTLKRIALKGAEPEIDFSPEEWWEFRIYAISLFLIYQTSFDHLRHNIGSREEADNYVRMTNSLIGTFPAWRRFWEEEASTGTFTKAFIDAVNSTTPGPPQNHIVEEKRPR